MLQTIRLPACLAAPWQATHTHTHTQTYLCKSEVRKQHNIWKFIFELYDASAIKLIKASPYTATVAVTPGALRTRAEARERRCGHGWAGAPGYTKDGCTTKPTQEITQCTGVKTQKASEVCVTFKSLHCEPDTFSLPPFLSLGWGMINMAPCSLNKLEYAMGWIQTSSPQLY